MTIQTRIGGFEIATDDSGALRELKFARRPVPDTAPADLPARLQLNEYLDGRRQTFDLPLAPDGTDFQKQVWAELVRIPYGETISYAELARRIGKPGAARAVGRANATNPIAIVVPCHRVIGASGTLTGYAYGMEMKSRLLDLERGQGRL